MKKITLLFSILSLLVSCSPKIQSLVETQREKLNYDADIFVFTLDEIIPEQVTKVGSIKVGDSGFTTKCKYEQVIEAAKLKAMELGANIVKITEHKLPTVLGSTCHRIKADIYYNKDVEYIKGFKDSENSIQIKNPNMDYALIHVYRYSGTGSLINYDVSLGDKKLCRVKNNFKTSIKVISEGQQTIWAKTEAKSEIELDIQKGFEYYVRCDVKMGAFVGRPSLELIDYKTGEQEFNSFKAKHSEN